MLHVMDKHRSGNRPTAKYREWVYLQDDDAVDGLEILERDGTQVAIDYLLRRGRAGAPRMLKKLVVPGNRRVVGNYTLFYDKYAPCIGLVETVD